MKRASARRLGGPAGLAAASLMVVLGCSSGSGGGDAGAGTSGGGGTGGASEEGACSLDTRVGGFAVQLVTLEGSAPYSSVSGGVRSGVTPLQVWQQKGAAAGGCKLMVGPSLVCTTPCMNPQICAGNNQCVDQPTLQNVGKVTVTGVGPSALTMDPIQNNYSTSLVDPFPPFSTGAAVRVAAAGAGAISGFALDATGIEPLAFEGKNLVMTNGEALSFTWTPAATASAARIFVKADIGHHGGVAAAVECDLPDTGTGEIPAELVTALITEGAHGFPVLSLTRRTVSSLSIAPGCVDFSLASPVERSIGVCPTASSCIISCDPSGPADQCPSGKTCKADFSCG